jgi:hypothetical protein
MFLLLPLEISNELPKDLGLMSLYLVYLHFQVANLLVY